jgi:SnoaL-like domain
MNGKRAWAIVGLAAAVLLGYFAWEWFLSPRARVERTLESAAVAAEALDLDLFLSHFSADYHDFLHGDREGLAANLKESFARVDRLNVTLRSIEVSVSGGEATARFDLVVVAVKGEERYVVLGTPFEAEKFEARLVRENGSWRIQRVDRGGSV